MARKIITGYSNPTIKFVRSLRDKKHRRREERFLAEGLRLLTDARLGELGEWVAHAEPDVHALAREVNSVIAANHLHHVTVRCLPALLHNRPQEIPGAVRAAVRAARDGVPVEWRMRPRWPGR